MRNKAMHVWKQLSRYTQGIILIMVSVMFFVWGIFGGAQVEKQNDAIAARVAHQHSELQSHMDQTLHMILAQGEYMTCVLRIPIDDRTPILLHKCYRQSGLNKLVRG